MLQSVIQYINIKLQTLRIFSQYYELAEKITRMDGTKQIYFPAVFQNEFKDMDFNKTPGFVYHMMNGQTSRTSVESIIGGRARIRHTIPMKLIAVVESSLFCNYDAFTPYKLTQSLSTILTESNSSALKTLLKVHVVNLSAGIADAMTESVHKDQFQNVAFQIPDGVFFVSVNYSIDITASIECFPVYDCNDETLNVKEKLIEILCTPTIETETTMVRSYRSNDPGVDVPANPKEKIFSDFAGFDIDNMMIITQAGGLMGHKTTLSPARKLVDAWDNTAGITLMTFKDDVPDDIQISIIGTL